MKESSLFTCENCYQIIDDYKNANVIYKINQNGVLRGPDIIHRDIHEGENTDYRWFRLNEINNNIFQIFIEYDIYKNNQSKIPLNFLNNWLDFVSEINNKYYQTNGESKIYVSYKKVKDISEDKKNGYFLSQLIELIDKIDEEYSRIDIDNSIIYDGINLVNGLSKIGLGKNQSILCKFFLEKNNMKYNCKFEDLVDYIYGKGETAFDSDNSCKSLINEVNSKGKKIGLRNIFSRKGGKVINNYYPST